MIPEVSTGSLEVPLSEGEALFYVEGGCRALNTVICPSGVPWAAFVVIDV
jgi:hypothetical protein